MKELTLNECKILRKNAHSIQDAIEILVYDDETVIDHLEEMQECMLVNSIDAKPHYSLYDLFFALNDLSLMLQRQIEKLEAQEDEND